MPRTVRKLLVAQGLALLAATALAGDAGLTPEQVRVIGMRISQALMPACVATPQLDAIYAIRASAPPELKQIVPGGAAHRAGVQEGDLLLAVNGKPAGGLNYKQVAGELLRDALSRALQTGEPARFTVQTGNAAPRELKLVPEMHCGMTVYLYLKDDATESLATNGVYCVPGARPTPGPNRKWLSCWAATLPSACSVATRQKRLTR